MTAWRYRRSPGCRAVAPAGAFTVVTLRSNCGHDRTRFYRGIRMRTDADTSSGYSLKKGDYTKYTEQVSASGRGLEPPWSCVECGADAGLTPIGEHLYCPAHAPATEGAQHG